MRRILLSLFMGGLLTWGSLWMLGYLPSKEASAKARSLEKLVDSFQNKTINYWVEDGHYQLILYGDLAFVRDFKGDPLWAYIQPSEFQTILEQFKKLPGLQEFKNTKADEVKPRSTHRVVFISEAPGLFPSLGELSYSIPKDENRDAYREWFQLIEAAIQKFKNERGVAPNRPLPPSQNSTPPVRDAED